MNFSKLALAMALSMAGVASYATELVKNGNFETLSSAGTDSLSAAGAKSPSAYFITVDAADSTTITGWTVGSKSVDVINTGYGAISGNSIDMLGTPGPGSLSQSLTTVAGGSYVLSFDLSSNPVLKSGDPAPVYALNVSLGGLSGSTAYTGTSTFQHIEQSFVAASNVTLLTFTSGTYGGYSGAVLDNVSVTAVSEPESFAMLLSGLGLMGVMARRRRNKNG